METVQAEILFRTCGLDTTGDGPAYKTRNHFAEDQNIYFSVIPHIFLGQLGTTFLIPIQMQKLEHRE